MAATEPRVKQWTRDDYFRMAEAGLFLDQRVELVEGEILSLSPMNPAHATSLQLAARALERAFDRRFCIRVQLPLTIDARSELEPDLAVVPGTPRDYTSHPTTALLVLEISDTTLLFDRSRKGPLYARSGVEEYWVVNLPDRCVEVHRFPCEGKYSQAWTVDVTGSISPLATPQVAIAVDELFP